MPEGDTIWRSARSLHLVLAGRRCVAARPASLDRLRGRTLDRVEAAGKHLLMRFAGGLTLHSHMRMSGSWHLYRPGESWRRSARMARAELDFGEHVAVCFSAPVVRLVGDLGAVIGHLGPDVLAESWDLAEVLARARTLGDVALGELLLDQRVAAGIGNVYRCEALWTCGLDPWMAASALSDAELGALFEEARAAMRANLSARGYERRFPGHGRAAVHGRRHRPCPRCEGRITARPQGEQGRIVYWCPGCQAPPR